MNKWKLCPFIHFLHYIMLSVSVWPKIKTQILNSLLPTPFDLQFYVNFHKDWHLVIEQLIIIWNFIEFDNSSKDEWLKLYVYGNDFICELNHHKPIINWVFKFTMFPYLFVSCHGQSPHISNYIFNIWFFFDLHISSQITHLNLIIFND
jgi:hypothetical protein